MGASRNRNRRLAIAAGLAAQPTATRLEHAPARWVREFAARSDGLSLDEDRYGNLVVRTPERGRASGPPLVLVAHLDHPGFVARSMLDARTLQADFRGGVLASVMANANVRFFRDDADDIGVAARVLTVDADETGYAKSATLRVRETIEAEAIGMFDVGVGRFVGKRFHSRACDDLAGAASALAMLADLAAKPAGCDVCVLLTRGEEAGFVGAIASVVKPTLLRKTDRVVSIETSAEQPVAVQGKGVVLRVGDRTSVFHSAFGRFFFETAEALKKADATFQFQRALMPGGTCEGTVFDAYGYVAAAVCIPLGNYHNMDRARNRVAAEYVHVDDWRNMVRLFVAAARNAHTFDGTHASLKAKLMKRFETNRALLR
jgi:endoglucanase